MAALTLRMIEELDEWTQTAPVVELAPALAVLAALQGRIAARLLERTQAASNLRARLQEIAHESRN